MSRPHSPRPSHPMLQMLAYCANLWVIGHRGSISQDLLHCSSPQQKLIDLSSVSAAKSAAASAIKAYMAQNKDHGAVRKDRLHKNFARPATYQIRLSYSLVTTRHSQQSCTSSNFSHSIPMPSRTCVGIITTSLAEMSVRLRSFLLNVLRCPISGDLL